MVDAVGVSDVSSSASGHHGSKNDGAVDESTTFVGVLVLSSSASGYQGSKNDPNAGSSTKFVGVVDSSSSGHEESQFDGDEGV